MDETLEHTRVVHSINNPSDSTLLHELEQLEPALAGFPVSQLLDGFVRTEPCDRASAYRLVDSCLASWIGLLDSTINEFKHEPDVALAGVLSRQRGTRDALARLKVALSRAAVIRPNRGQLC